MIHYHRSPFNLKKNEELILLCRYLVEANKDPFVQVDMEKSQDLFKIRSIFQTVVGDYSLLSLEEQHDIYDKIVQIFKKYREAVVNNLAFLKRERKGEERELKDGLARIKEIEQTFDYIGAELIKKETDYFLTKMYQKTNDIEVIEVDYMFQYFNGSSFKEDQKYQVLSIHQQFTNRQLQCDNHQSLEVSIVE